MKKKEFLTEAKRKAIISDKEKAIIESFAKTFNKIKRIDENEINEFEEENPLYSRQQEYGINPEIEPEDFNQGVDIKEIIDNRMHPFFDFEQNKAYVELDDIDSILVYDFEILSSPINSQDPEEDYDGEISLTFNEGESQLNNGIEEYIGYIKDKITSRPNIYGFWEKWANEGYNAPDEPDYDEY